MKKIERIAMGLILAVVAVGVFGEDAKVIARYKTSGQPVFVKNPVVSRATHSSAIRTLDPSTCGDRMSNSVLGQIHEGLLSYSYLEFNGGMPKLQPCLAAAMPTVSADQLTYTFKLKKGVLFHRNPCFGKQAGVEVDGKMLTVYKTREVTAEDFVFAFKRQADPHNRNCFMAWPFMKGRVVGLDAWRAQAKAKFNRGGFSRYDESIEGVQALDRYTLQIKLVKSYPQFKFLFALVNLAPTPREAVDYWLAGKGGNPSGEIPVNSRRVEFTDYRSVVGTGPYRVESFKAKGRYVLVRNPDFRKDLYPTKADARLVTMGFLKDAGKAMPFIDKFVSTYSTDDKVCWQAFMRGERDASGIPWAEFPLAVTPDKTISKTHKAYGLRLAKVWDPGHFYLTFNMKDPILGASKSLRQAICLGFDVESYIKTQMNGRGRRAQMAVPGDFNSARNVIARIEKMKKKDKFFNYYNLALAKKKLIAAKKELVAKGLLVNGEIPEITLDLDWGNKWIMEFYAKQFAAMGLKVKLVENDFPTLMKKAQHGKFQIISGGWHADYFDAENFLQLYYGPNAKLGLNTSHYSNPEYDKLFESIREMPDSPERTKRYERMIEILCDDCPMAMLFERQSYVLRYEWYKNHHLMPLGSGYLKYRRIDAALREKIRAKNLLRIRSSDPRED